MKPHKPSTFFSKANHASREGHSIKAIKLYELSAKATPTLKSAITFISKLALSRFIEKNDSILSTSIASLSHGRCHAGDGRAIKINRDGHTPSESISKYNDFYARLTISTIVKRMLQDVQNFNDAPLNCGFRVLTTTKDLTKYSLADVNPDLTLHSSHSPFYSDLTKA